MLFIMSHYLVHSFKYLFTFLIEMDSRKFLGSLEMFSGQQKTLKYNLVFYSYFVMVYIWIQIQITPISVIHAFFQFQKFLMKIFPNIPICNDHVVNLSIWLFEYEWCVNNHSNFFFVIMPGRMSQHSTLYLSHFNLFALSMYCLVYCDVRITSQIHNYE